MKITNGKIIFGLMVFSIIFGAGLSLNNYFLYERHLKTIQILKPTKMSDLAQQQMAQAEIDRIERDYKLKHSLVNMTESLLKRNLFHSKLYLVIFVLLAVLLCLFEKYILSKIQHNKPIKQD